jgi:uncharacterized BrkB/YihY/UPF0761 family membrane protein
VPGVISTDEYYRRGPSLSPTLVDSVLALLSHPAVAAVLGIVFGVGLLLASRASFRAITPESPEAGLGFVAVSLFIRMGLSAGALFVYHRFIPEGFVPFAAGVAGGFLVLYGVELTRYGRVLVRPR